MMLCAVAVRPDSVRWGNSKTRSALKCVSSISTVYGADSEMTTYPGPGTGCRHCAEECDIEEVSGTVLLVAKDDGVPKRVLHDSSKALPYRGRRYVNTGTRNRELRTVRPQTPVYNHMQACIGSLIYILYSNVEELGMPAGCI